MFAIPAICPISKTSLLTLSIISRPNKKICAPRQRLQLVINILAIIFVSHCLPFC